MAHRMHYWRISKAYAEPGNYYRIRGYYHGDSQKYGEGEYVYTPEVVSVELMGDDIAFGTEDGLFLCAIDGHGGYAEDIPRMLSISKGSLAEEDLRSIVDRINANRDAELAKERDVLLSHMPEKLDTFTIVEFSTEEYSLFSRMAVSYEGKVAYLEGGTEWVHQSITQDSVLLAGGVEAGGADFDYDLGKARRLPDIRYFPYSETSLEFYVIDCDYKPLLLRNAGPKPLDILGGRETITIQPGCIIELPL